MPRSNNVIKSTGKKGERGEEKGGGRCVEKKEKERGDKVTTRKRGRAKEDATLVRNIFMHLMRCGQNNFLE